MTTVQVAYGTDVEPLMAEMARVVGEVPRVLADPPVGVR
jgi:small-conductance mechanosensitive channel